MKNKQKIAGICRVRNAKLTIKEVLKHVSKIVDEIYIWDDFSTDNTIEICQQFEKVKYIQVTSGEWSGDPKERNKLEGDARQHLYNEAVSNGADWVYCFDADEFLEFDKGINLEEGYDAYYFRLFDFYITPEDKNKSWKSRKYIGREYREIIMLFRVKSGIKFKQREPSGIDRNKAKFGGWVKHYGKAISIKDWERKCQYYVNNRGGNFLPQFKRKWKDRLGKAIHTVSDFGSPLIIWDEKEKFGEKLVEGNSWFGANRNIESSNDLFSGYSDNSIKNFNVRDVTANDISEMRLVDLLRKASVKLVKGGSFNLIFWDIKDLVEQYAHTREEQYLKYIYKGCRMGLEEIRSVAEKEGYVISQRDLSNNEDRFVKGLIFTKK